MEFVKDINELSDSDNNAITEDNVGTKAEINSEVKAEIKKELSKEEMDKINKAKENAELKKKLLKQMNEQHTDEVFDSFVKHQKKQTKKKFLITVVVCFILLGIPIYILYKEYFANDSITRKTYIGMSYNNVIESENSFLNAKEPEAIGESMLIYSNVKYKSLSGDVIYYFHQAGKNLSMIAFKFGYSQDDYNYLLKSLEKDYGKYSEDEKKENEDIRVKWLCDDGTIIRLVSSKVQNTIEIDVGKSDNTTKTADCTEK